MACGIQNWVTTTANIQPGFKTLIWAQTVKLCVLLVVFFLQIDKFLLNCYNKKKFCTIPRAYCTHMVYCTTEGHERTISQWRDTHVLFKSHVSWATTNVYVTLVGKSTNIPHFGTAAIINDASSGDNFWVTRWRLTSIRWRKSVCKFCLIKYFLLRKKLLIYKKKQCS